MEKHSPLHPQPRDGDRCRECGAASGAVQRMFTHHIVPRAQGGTTTSTTSCSSANPVTAGSSGKPSRRVCQPAQAEECRAVVERPRPDRRTPALLPGLGGGLHPQPRPLRRGNVPVIRSTPSPPASPTSTRLAAPKSQPTERAFLSTTPPHTRACGQIPPRVGGSDNMRRRASPEERGCGTVYRRLRKIWKAWVQAGEADVQPAMVGRRHPVERLHWTGSHPGWGVGAWRRPSCVHVATGRSAISARSHRIFTRQGGQIRSGIQRRLHWRAADL